VSTQFFNLKCLKIKKYKLKNISENPNFWKKKKLSRITITKKINDLEYIPFFLFEKDLLQITGFACSIRVELSIFPLLGELFAW